MAGSRLVKFGTVYTRIRDLMRAGVLKPSDRPIWYDIYEAFPPIRDPLYVKEWKRPAIKKENAVPEILYEEDAVRAKFYEQYVGGRPLDLSKSNFVSLCQRFVDKYSELRHRGDIKESALFEETGKALLADGVLLRRKGDPPVAAESRDPLLNLKLTEMLAEHLAEQQTEETKTHTDRDTNT